MKKLVKLGVAALVAVSFGGLTVTTADAATWHKGLPKIIRNKMYRTKFDMTYPNDPQFTWYKGTKSTLMEHATQGGAADKISKTKYKKVGKTYVIHGYDKLGTARNKMSGKSGKVYGYVRVRKLSNKKIKIADGKKTTKYEGKYLTMQRFYHFPRVNGRVQK
ncbi:hypothetical protein [Levilactobacillus mulengensis]|uniref:hypothetical protein n=1 Tax=Levilactobacillus mulengensis TaxID=2486025 RepID=UPI000F7AF7E1|nr:hypothetical protein [Levilactobacillus mulengensis]